MPGVGPAVETAPGVTRRRKPVHTHRFPIFLFVIFQFSEFSMADDKPKTRLMSLDDLDRRTKAAQLAFDLHDRLMSERGGAGSMGVLRAAMVKSVAVRRSNTRRHYGCLASPLT
jgi:hypothetical protein